MTQQDWDKKIIEFGGGILQSWVWGEFQSAVGHEVKRFSNDAWAAQLTGHEMSMGKKYWYAPRGPVGNPDQAKDSLLKEFQSDKDVIFLRFEPQEPIALPESPKEIQPKENWFVGLEGSEQELLVSMKPKHRYNINLAIKKGVMVRQASKEDFLNVWTLLLETASRAGIRLHPQNYYLQMWEKLSPDYLKVFISEFEGQLLSCAFVTYFGKTATYLHGGSSDKNKQLMAPYAMQWHAMKDAKASGYFNYDMGGYTSDPNHSWAGISRFKTGFGGYPVRYPGTFDLVLSPLWYNVYKNTRTLKKILRGAK